MKVVVIGASHGGIQAVVTMKRLNPQIDVTLIEKRNNVSYVSSGLVLKMTGVVDKLNDVRYISALDLEELGITVLLNSEVTEIDSTLKKVAFKNKAGFHEIIYEKLILATGSNQFSTNLTLPSQDKVTVFKDYISSVEVLERISDAKVISIIGGGYIGTELCDGLKETGKKIHLIESADTVLFRYIDKELAAIIKQRMEAYNIELHLNESVIGFKETDQNSFITQTTNEEISNDYVIIAVNARPDTSLVRDFLDLNSNGTIRVNEQMQTSDADVYAVGDVVSYPIQNSFRKSFIPLVSNVARSATVAAMNVLGNKMSYVTTQKTTASKIFDLYVASSGLTEVEARFEGIEVESIFISIPYQLPFIKEQEEVHIKLVFAKGSQKVIGGQIMSEKDITESINTLSLAIAKEVTLEELVTMDFFFNPGINQPMGIISRAAYEFLMKQHSIT